MSPFALLWRNRRVVDLFLIGLIQLLILVPMAVTSRLTLLGIIPLAMSGAMAVSLAWSAIPRAATRNALACVAALALAGQLVLVLYVFVTSWRFMPYLVGAETEETYLARTRDFYRAYKWIAEATPPDAKLLLIAENRTFHLDRRAIAAGNLDGARMSAYLAQFTTPQALHDALARESFRYVVIHKPWYRVENGGTASPGMLAQEYVLTVSPRTDAVLRQYLAHTRLVYQDAAYVIYAL